MRKIVLLLGVIAGAYGAAANEDLPVGPGEEDFTPAIVQSAVPSFSIALPLAPLTQAAHDILIPSHLPSSDVCLIVENVEQYARNASSEKALDRIRDTRYLVRPWMNGEAIIAWFSFWDQMDADPRLVAQEISPVIDLFKQSQVYLSEASAMEPNQVCKIASDQMVVLAATLGKLGRGYDDICKEVNYSARPDAFMKSAPIGLGRSNKYLGKSSIERIIKVLSFYQKLHHRDLPSAVIPDIISVIVEEGVRNHMNSGVQNVEIIMKGLTEKKVLPANVVAWVLENFLQLDRIMYKRSNWNCQINLFERSFMLGQAQGACIRKIQELMSSPSSKDTPLSRQAVKGIFNEALILTQGQFR